MFLFWLSVIRFPSDCFYTNFEFAHKKTAVEMPEMLGQGVKVGISQEKRCETDGMETDFSNKLWRGKLHASSSESSFAEHSIRSWWKLNYIFYCRLFENLFNICETFGCKLSLYVSRQPLSWRNTHQKPVQSARSQEHIETKKKRLLHSFDAPKPNDVFIVPCWRLTFC